MMRPRKQQPGGTWTFPCGHSGTLPVKFGATNDFAVWNRQKRLIEHGIWVCRLCCYSQRKRVRCGEGKSGVLGRMRYLLSCANRRARYAGHATLNTTAEEMVEMWLLQKDQCAACGRRLFLLQADFDHSHETGEARGFLCHACNVLEGYSKDYTKEQFSGFCRYAGRGAL